jgi:hypothetical protein
MNSSQAHRIEHLDADIAKQRANLVVHSSGVNTNTLEFIE